MVTDKLIEDFNSDVKSVTINDSSRQNQNILILNVDVALGTSDAFVALCEKSNEMTSCKRMAEVGIFC